MGCSDSKETGTDDQNKKPTDKPEDKKDDPKDTNKAEDSKPDNKDDKDAPKDGTQWKTKEDAVEYIVKELGVRRENAEKIVDQVNDDGNEKLNEDEVQELWKTVVLARDELKPMFLEADANNTGKVTVTEASRVLAKIFPKMDEKGMRKMMRKFDSGDKIVQYGEFIIFYVFIQQSGDTLRPMFEAADSNNTGKVTLSEATNALCERFPSMDERSVKRMLYRCDDGNGIISYEEFIHFYATLQMSKKAVVKKFQNLDKDGDGKVPEEAVIKMMMEETGMDEDDCKAIVNQSDEGNDSRVTEEEFINSWSKLTGK